MGGREGFRIGVCCVLMFGLGCGRIGYESQPDADSDPALSGGDGDASSAGDGDGSTAGDGDGSNAGDGDGSSAGDGDGSTGGDGDGSGAGDGDAAGDGDGDAGAMMDAATPDCAPLGDHDYCASIPALTEAPTIDGVLDCGLPLVDFTPVGWTSTEPIPAAHVARYAIGHRPEGLYVFIEVTDATLLPAPASDPPWRGDGVEVYVDDDGTFGHPIQYDDPGTVQLVAASPDDSAVAIRRGARFRDAVLLGDWTSAEFTAVATADGYAFEALIAAPALDLAAWTLAAGQRIGLNLSINVSHDGSLDADAGVGLEGTRLGQYFLRDGGGGCGHPFCSVGSFCTPVLAE